MLGTMLWVACCAAVAAPGVEQQPTTPPVHAAEQSRVAPARPTDQQRGIAPPRPEQEDRPTAPPLPSEEQRRVEPSPALVEPEHAPATEEPQRTLRVGTEGLFNPGLLLQGWFYFDRTAGDTDTSFRVRRAEIALEGVILPNAVAYAVMFDPAKVLEPRPATVAVVGPDGELVGNAIVEQPVSALSVFQDFFITYTSRWVDASIGQFKIPVSYEGYNSSSRLLFPERAVVSRAVGDRRDLGIRLTKFFEHFGYFVGVFNGAGLNRRDDNNAKDLALRLEAYPIEGVVVAGVAYGSVGPSGRAATGSERYEADLRIEHGRLLVQSEYIHARDAVRGEEPVIADGFYLAVAWSFLAELQVAARCGYFDPDRGRDLDPQAEMDADERWHFDGGVNYYVLGNQMKLQLSYSRFQFDDRQPLDEVIFAVQVAY